MSIDILYTDFPADTRGLDFCLDVDDTALDMETGGASIDLTGTYFVGAPLNSVATPSPQCASPDHYFVSVGTFSSPGASTSGTALRLLVDCSATASGLLTLDFQSATLTVGTAGQAITANDGDISATATPVELGDFDAVTIENGIQLSWNTLSEENNAGFEVQYAEMESDEFINIGWVEGFGTTLEEQSYTFSSPELMPGDYQFRLKQVDFDGKFEYSPVVEGTVTVPGTFIVQGPYPNPFNPTTQIRFAVAQEQVVDLELFDATGRRVMTLFSGTATANETIDVRVDAASLPSGMYLARLVGDSFSTTKKLMLVK
ncbi:MAG: T9SS type A sorting domain-containing protein [Bacteroidota bacterium]